MSQVGTPSVGAAKKRYNTANYTIASSSTVNDNQKHITFEDKDRPDWWGELVIMRSERAAVGLFIHSRMDFALMLEQFTEEGEVQLWLHQAQTVDQLFPRLMQQQLSRAQMMQNAMEWQDFALDLLMGERNWIKDTLNKYDCTACITVQDKGAAELPRFVASELGAVKVQRSADHTVYRIGA